MSKKIETHPIQAHNRCYPRLKGRCPKVVTMRAYEVYKALCGEQAALVTGDCRGGFGIEELISFLYARSFPREEWKRRQREAVDGMKNLS